MRLSIDQGKVTIAALLRAEANNQSVKLKDVRWWHQVDAEEPYSLEASNAETGRTESKRFSTQHLTLWQDDNQMKVQVAAKITGLVIQLKKAIGQH